MCVCMFFSLVMGSRSYACVYRQAEETEHPQKQEKGIIRDTRYLRYRHFSNAGYVQKADGMQIPIALTTQHQLKLKCAP